MEKNLVVINGKEVSRMSYKDKAVVTLKMVDELHERPTGTARRNFNSNKKHFIENEDYFVVPYEEWSEIHGTAGRISSRGGDISGLKRRNSSRSDELLPLSVRNSYAQRGGHTTPMIFLTESGYCMLTKSFSDDLSWQIQRQLVNRYFAISSFHDQLEQTGGFKARPDLILQGIAACTREADRRLGGKVGLYAANYVTGMPVDDLIQELEALDMISSEVAGTIAQYFSALLTVDMERFEITSGTTETNILFVEGEGRAFYNAFLFLQRKEKLPKIFTSLQSLSGILSREAPALEYLGIRRILNHRIEHGGKRIHRFEFLRQKES